jgi:hypothetical protein
MWVSMNVIQDPRIALVRLWGPGVESAGEIVPHRAVG